MTVSEEHVAAPTGAREVTPRQPDVSRPWLPGALAAAAGFAVVGILLLLWFGLAQRDKGTVGPSGVPFRQAPNFELGLFDGSTYRLNETLASGKPAVVNFWASWCVPCREEAPLLESTWQRNRERLSLVGVDVQDTDEDALAFLREFGITYPNGAGNSGPISISYGMRGVPETYFIATDRQIIRKWNGALTGAGLEQFLDELQRASAKPGS